MIAIVSMIVSVGTHVLAAPVEIDGDIRIRIQNRSGDTDSPAKGTFTITRIRLNENVPVTENISLYSRFAIDQAAGKAYNNGLYDTDGAFDRWGINWKYKNGSLKLGRQDVVLGQENLVLGTLIDAVGENNQLTGLTAIWKMGNNSLKLVGGRLGSGLFQPLKKIEANLYGLQMDHKVNQRLNIGGTYRQVATIDQYSAIRATLYPPHKDVLNTYSLFASYYLDAKTIAYTEFGYSNADQYNSGLGIGISHRMDMKNSYSINYFRQGINSGLLRNWGAPDFARWAGNTTWQGVAIYYRYQMDRNTSLEVSDYYEKGNVNNAANQFRIAVMTKF